MSGVVVTVQTIPVTRQIPLAGPVVVVVTHSVIHATALVVPAKTGIATPTSNVPPTRLHASYFDLKK